MSGYPAALVEWWKDLKADFEQWRYHQLPWKDVGSTLLLSGPPGTGQTVFAQALSNTLKLPLLRTSVSSWMQGGHLNDVVKRVTECFDEARVQAVILFIDEIDGIGSRDTVDKDYSDYWITIVNKLLESLNGLSRMEGLILVGATNRPQATDPALLRSGRLQPHLEMGLPDTAALAGIFRHYLGTDLKNAIGDAPFNTVEV